MHKQLQADSWHYAVLDVGLGDVHQQVNNSSNQTGIADESRAVQGHGVRGKDFLSEQIQCSYRTLKN